MIYHLVLKKDWNAQASHYAPPSLEHEGFIHFSTKAQVAGTYERFYKNQEMYLLTVDESKLKAELKYESADGDEYPHLYGPLNLDAVISIESYEHS